ncbi:MAG: response regulator transcription factor [Bryobacteraceae bacterium]
MIRIILISEQPILAKGLEAVIEADGGMQLAGNFPNIRSLLESTGVRAPDLLVIDWLPEMDFGILADLRTLPYRCSAVLWAHNISIPLAYQAMRLGIRGILRKTLPASVHTQCFRKVVEGEVWFEKAITDTLLTTRLVSLSRREGQLVSLLSHGMKNREISGELGISEGAVKVYLSRILKKVGARDRFELALVGRQNLGMRDPAFDRPPAGAPVPHNVRTLLIRNEPPPGASLEESYLATGT